MDYLCLAEHHFQPEVIETYPYERLSHATLAWLKENQEMCDVLQVWHPVTPLHPRHS